MNGNVDPFLIIKSNYIQMKPAMKRIANVVLAQPMKSDGYTIGKLAEKSHVSTATVTRFVRNLGFENYKTFLKAIRNSLIETQKRSNLPVHKTMLRNVNRAVDLNDTESICRYVIGNEIELLSDTLSLLDFGVIERVVDWIMKARHVLFLGEGRSYLAAESACLRFQRLGVLCNCHGDVHSMIPEISMADPSDLVIGISNMGRSVPVTGCVKRAKKRGIKTVAITSVKGSPLNHAADLSILTGFNYGNATEPNEIIGYEPGSENIPQHSVINCLYLMCVLRKDETFPEKYAETAMLIEGERKNVNLDK